MEWIVVLLLVISSFCFVLFTLQNISHYDTLFIGDWYLISSLLISVICFFIELIIRRTKKKDDEISSIKSDMRLRDAEHEKKIKQINADHERVRRFMNDTNKSLVNLLKSKTPFKDVASMKADFETCIYKKDEHYLRYKPHPAASSADKVQEIRKAYRISLLETKQMLYKYEFLLSVFPELKSYFEDEESIIHIQGYKTIDNFNDNRDRVRDWISNEEYRMMPIDDRNQLALDKYKSRKKSDWEIGIEYELYIGYLLREGLPPFNEKYKVIQYGEKHGLQDLGRDIIAKKINQEGDNIIYIIQCKRWSENKLIHENAICQLYGTTVEYKIKNKTFLSSTYEPIFVSTTELSQTANEFAKTLGVKFMKISMGDYPMIKCNINNGEKIYHLPFDPQYHRTEIKNDGEFYAMTVKEATSNGFRRAMKHIITNNPSQSKHEQDL